MASSLKIPRQRCFTWETPRVLVDPGSPVEIRATQDHIEVKLVMILPVDHPHVSNVDSVFKDFMSLSSKGSVHFYCKSCSKKLTKEPLRNFVEMPSVNCQEVADNWFGSYCCSFGGISETLVYAYANSYSCSEGTCLLDNASITTCKDDLLGNMFPAYNERVPNLIGESAANSCYEEKHNRANMATEATAEHGNTNECIFRMSSFTSIQTFGSASLLH